MNGTDFERSYGMDERVPVSLLEAVKTSLLKLAVTPIGRLELAESQRSQCNACKFTYAADFMIFLDKELQGQGFVYSWIDDLCGALGNLWVSPKPIPPKFLYALPHFEGVRIGYVWDDDLAQAIEDVIIGTKTIDQVAREALVAADQATIEADNGALSGEATYAKAEAMADLTIVDEGEVEDDDEDESEEQVFPFIIDPETGSRLRIPDYEELCRVEDVVKDHIRIYCGNDHKEIKQIEKDMDQVRHLRSLVCKLPELLHAYGDLLHALAIPEEAIDEEDRDDGEGIEFDEEEVEEE